MTQESTPSYQIFQTPPQNFVPSMEASGCYCRCENKILLVKRQSYKSQGNKWGVPAGKLEIKENPVAAIIREFFEEVGISLHLESLQKMCTFFIRIHPMPGLVGLPSTDYIYHMFCTSFDSFPPVNLNLDENQEAKWLTIEEALKLPLVAAGKEALFYYQKFLASSPTQ